MHCRTHNNTEFSPSAAGCPQPCDAWETFITQAAPSSIHHFSSANLHIPWDEANYHSPRNVPAYPSWHFVSRSAVIPWGTSVLAETSCRGPCFALCCSQAPHRYQLHQVLCGCYGVTKRVRLDRSCKRLSLHMRKLQTLVLALEMFHLFSQYLE